MNCAHYLQRIPLLDAEQHAMGYLLAWQRGRTTVPAGASLPQLSRLVNEHRQAPNGGLFFMAVQPAALSVETVQQLSPERFVPVFDLADLTTPGAIGQLMALHAQGFSLALRGVDAAFLASGDDLLSLVRYVLADDAGPALAAMARLSRQAQPALSLLVGQAPDWPAFQACAALGLPVFFENLCTAPRQPSPSAQLSTQSALILQLMQMVQANAGIRELEKVLQRDATLSYNLLRHINSANFALQVESLHQAVTMLGYAPLYRWLSMLLARSSPSGFSPALLNAAIVRGRFVELLGLKMLSGSEAGNLFVVGLFSLLDQLLGMPMAQVLRQVALSESVVQALASHEGVYGPFLALAQACERGDGGAAERAEALFMTPADVNQAHWAALVWAQNIGL